MCIEWFSDVSDDAPDTDSRSNTLKMEPAMGPKLQKTTQYMDIFKEEHINFIILYF